MLTRWNTVAGNMTVAITLLLGLVATTHAASAQDDGTPPIAATPEEITLRPAHIHTGTCDDLGDVVYPLNDISTVDVSTFEELGAVGQSTTMIEVPLDELSTAEHAANVHESTENIDEYIACGDITGVLVDGQLTIELQELNASGYTGEAVLEDLGNSTTAVSLVLTESDTGLSATPVASPVVDGDEAPAVEAQAGDDQFEVGTILATTDENLRVRADSSTDSEILAVLPEGSELQVTGGPEEGEDYTWYEVDVLDGADPVTGWVADDFVEPVLEVEE